MGNSSVASPSTQSPSLQNLGSSGGALRVVPDRDGVMMLTNDGARTIMLGEGDAAIPVATVLLQAKAKRGYAWNAACPARDALAAKIVRAVNSHDDLLAALKELHAAYDAYDGGSISEKRISRACEAAEDAIAKAEGAKASA